MICNNCGTQINDNAKFCPKCGIALSTNNYNYPTNAGYVTPKTNTSSNGLVMGLVIVAMILVGLVCAITVFIFIGNSEPETIEPAVIPTVIPTVMPTQTAEVVQYSAPVFNHIEASSTRGADMTSGVAVNYFPSYAIDGDISTTWSPNRNYGLTPTLTLYADSKQHVNGIRMANGYFKSSQTYTRNRRITKVRIEYDGGYKTQSFGIDQYRIMQDIKFDAPADTSFIRIQVLETYYGDWKDICISEVEVY